MVDLAPQSWEVYITPPMLADGTTPTCPNGATRCWRTVILGGERGGGDVYFAIDVTDPNNPGVLWEYSGPRTGLYMPTPYAIPSQLQQVQSCGCRLPSMHSRHVQHGQGMAVS